MSVDLANRKKISVCDEEQRGEMLLFAFHEGEEEKLNNHNNKSVRK